MVVLLVPDDAVDEGDGDDAADDGDGDGENLDRVVGREKIEEYSLFKAGVVDEHLAADVLVADAFGLATLLKLFYGELGVKNDVQT